MSPTDKMNRALVSTGELTPDSGHDPWLELIALFIHDLESPLASVKYVLKLLNDNKLDLQKPRHQQLISSSHLALGRAESIVYDLLVVAKSGSHEMVADLQSIPLSPILDDVVLLGTAAASENQIAVKLEDRTPHLHVLADPHLLARVLDNLIFNAIRHTPSGMSIHVSSQIESGVVRLSVLDGGEGLGDVDPSMLFEKYGQVQLRASGKHRGVGLGLYFCKLAVLAMGGSITAENHPSGGADFSVRLRVA